MERQLALGRGRKVPVLGDEVGFVGVACERFEGFAESGADKVVCGAGGGVDRVCVVQVVRSGSWGYTGRPQTRLIRYPSAAACTRPTRNRKRSP